MSHSCHCPNHHKESHTTSSQYQQQIDHTVGLLLEKFISPYKILYMLDPTQADHFKQRNQPQGCCTANHITIPGAQLTHTEKLLSQLITPPQVAKNLDKILCSCAESHRNIIEKGKQDKLEINDQVDKFVMDKVIGECANNFFYQLLAKEVRESSVRVHKEIGLWATPASWYQKYPQISLQFIATSAMAQLMGRGWTTIKKFISNSGNIQKQVRLLEKDGKFEEAKWLVRQDDGSNNGRQTFKTLANPQRYADLCHSQDDFLFPGLRQATLSVSAIPFELNLKANLFCTVSPNIHICYASVLFAGKMQKGELRFTVLLSVSQGLKVFLDEKEDIALEGGDLVIIDNERHSHRIVYDSLDGLPLILMRNFIEVVEKK